MSATPATIALSSAGIPLTGHEYQHDPGTTDFGREALATAESGKKAATGRN